MTTYKGNRGLAQTFIRSAVSRGLSANAGLREYQAGGGKLRRIDWLRDFRQFLGVPARAQLLKYVRPDYRPSERLYTRVAGYQRTDYRYTVLVTTRNPETGVEFTFFNNVSSERPMTPGEASEEALSAVGGAIDRYRDDVVAYHLVSAFVQPGVIVE